MVSSVIGLQKERPELRLQVRGLTKVKEINAAPFIALNPFGSEIIWVTRKSIVHRQKRNGAR